MYLLTAHSYKKQWIIVRLCALQVQSQHGPVLCQRCCSTALEIHLPESTGDPQGKPCPQPGIHWHTTPCFQTSPEDRQTESVWYFLKYQWYSHHLYPVIWQCQKFIILLPASTKTQIKVLFHRWKEWVYLPDVVLSSQWILYSSQYKCHMRQTGQPGTVHKKLKHMQR